jgi:hypothetical protein
MGGEAERGDKSAENADQREEPTDHFKIPL